MSETFVPRFQRAGGRLLASTRAERLTRVAGKWHIRARHEAAGGSVQALTIVANRVFVLDPPLYSSAGVTTGIDLMLHVLGQVTDQACAAATARFLVVYLRRGGADPQLSPWLEGRNHVHPAIHRVQDAIAAVRGHEFPAALSFQNFRD